MSEITALHFGRDVVAFDAEDMVNGSVLAKHYYGRNTAEFLTRPDTAAIIAIIAERTSRPLKSQWLGMQTRLKHTPDYLRDLESTGIIRRVAGTPGGHIAAGPGIAGNGVRDYSPGLWVHPDLATNLARWLECGAEDLKPGLLAEFIDQMLAERRGTSASHIKTKTPKSAADSFAGTVDARTLENLRAVDQILINGGLSLSERQQTLRARLEQQARREG